MVISVSKMKRLTNVLVAIDLTPFEAETEETAERILKSNPVVQSAFSIAKRFSAKLCFLYVADRAETSRDPESGKLSFAHQVLSSAVDAAQQALISADYHICVGSPVDQILSLTHSNQYDLLLIGTRHHGFFRSLWSQNSETPLVRRCPCPVWISNSRTVSYHSVMILYQPGDGANLVIECGARLAEGLQGELSVFHALHFPEMDHFTTSAIPSEVIQSAKREVIQEVSSVLRRSNRRVIPRFCFEYDPISAPLLKAIKSSQVDITVIEASDQSNLKLADFISQHTSSSLVVVKP